MSVCSCHFVPSIAASMGGPSVSVPSLCKNIKLFGGDVEICTLDDSHLNGPVSDVDLTGVNVVKLPVKKLLGNINRAVNFSHQFQQNIKNAQVIHSHGVWLPVYKHVANVASKMNIPHIITPRGMLEPWILKRNRWKKKLALIGYQQKILNDATCFNATAEAEAKSLRDLGIKQPIAVIPNGLDVSGYLSKSDSLIVESKWPQLAGKKVILFMSRIHPKKGLLNLAKVWGDLRRNHKDWHLVIAGPEDIGHEAEVRIAIDKAGATDSTLFTGPVYGELKKQLFAACDFFVLPTFSENFGIVVAEALASEKPVITTTGTPWNQLQTHDCGWYIDIGIEPLEAAMKTAIDMSNLQRKEMGQRGRKLIEENYSWPRIASQMTDVYKWILGQGEMPDCVRLD